MNIFEKILEINLKFETHLKNSEANRSLYGKMKNKEVSAEKKKQVEDSTCWIFSPPATDVCNFKHCLKRATSFNPYIPSASSKGHCQTV